MICSTVNPLEPIAPQHVQCAATQPSLIFRCIRPFVRLPVVDHGVTREQVAMNVREDSEAIETRRGR